MRTHFIQILAKRDQSRGLTVSETDRATSSLPLEETRRAQVAATGDLEALVAACEREFGGPIMDNFEDDDDVMGPPSGITFGMIRRARAALEVLNGG